MKKKLILCLFVSAFLLLSCVEAQSQEARSQGKPNVLIIFIDDMGYGDLSCYGNTQIQTKNIDALAQSGTCFRQFYANSPVCSPSRVAMLTGQYPARHHFYTYLAERKRNEENGMPHFLPASVPTLAKMMHANGYATAHIGKWHLGGGRDVGDAPLPTEYGFDKSFTSFEGLGDRTLHLTDNLNKQSAALGRGNIVEAPQNMQTRMYVDSTLAFIKANQDRPFFIHFFPNDVHDPYNPIDGTEKEFAAVTANPDQQKFLATLQEMDNQIGRLLSELKKMKKLDNTLILLTSDNGPTDWPRYYKNGGEPPCSAGDLRGRKWSLYEGGIRVPFIAVWPGKIPANRTDDKTIMSVVDFTPTIARLTRTNVPGDYIADGEDKSKALLGKKQPVSKDIYWYYNNQPLPGKQENISPTLAIRSGKWKLLMDADGTKKQLFNMDTDYKETKNLSETEKNITATLSAKLKKWYDSFLSPF